MSWTEGEFYRFYTDKEIKNVYKKITDIVENKLKFKYEYTEFNDEKNLFFLKLQYEIEQYPNLQFY